MKSPIKPYFVCMLLLSLVCSAWPAESCSASAAGRREYSAGEFKKAAAHFARALKVDPGDADSYFWLGKSYEMLADIGGPVLGARASVRARFSLSKALELAPENEDYRRELFQLLIVSDHSPGALRQAESIIQMTPERHPDYPFMLARLHQEYTARSSPEDRLRCAVSVVPQQFGRITR